MAKTDMERVGLFSEQGYTTITDPYVPPTGSEYRDHTRSKRGCFFQLSVLRETFRD